MIFVNITSGTSKAAFSGIESSASVILFGQFSLERFKALNIFSAASGINGADKTPYSFIKLKKLNNR